MENKRIKWATFFVLGAMCVAPAFSNIQSAKLSAFSTPHTQVCEINNTNFSNTNSSNPNFSDISDICFSNTSLCNTDFSDLHINQLKGTSEITITNTNLRNRIYSLLNKNTTSRLYSTDFLNNENYKPRKETSGSTEIWVANRTWLDLSNLDIDDISELIQFEFPETLVAIDLSNNNFSTSSISRLQTLLNATKDTDIILNGETVTPLCNFASIIKKVNLTFNNIDLNAISTDTLNDSRLLFGIQNINSSMDKFCLKNDISNAKYYIRTDDDIYLSYNFFFDSSRYSYKQNVIASLSEKGCGDFEIQISNPPSSESGYFYGYTTSTSFTVFNIKIKDTFTVERKSMFNLNVDTSNPTNMDIEIEGLTINNCKIDYPNTTTSVAGTNYVALHIIYNDFEKTISLPFNVIDTTPPTITLLGLSKMYWRQNKSWVDPGYIGMDSGDDITMLVDVNNLGLDVTTCGKYTITYTLVDQSGLSATPVTREVIVQEDVLDEIIVSTNKDEYKIGDEVILTVQPSNNINASNYKDYKYYWYINGELFKTSTGDKNTGKSAITMILDKTTLSHKIEVRLTAKQTVDDSEITVTSTPINIKTKVQVADSKAIVIACSIAVAIILIIICGVTIWKAKKSKSKIAKSKKSKVENTKTTQNDIQVIKDYDDKNKKQ